MSEKFIRLDQASMKGGMKFHHGPGSAVIKNNAVNESKTARKIVHRSAKPQVEAIIENSIVTGVRIKCACGEVTEVFFQYDPSR